MQSGLRKTDGADMVIGANDGTSFDPGWHFGKRSGADEEDGGLSAGLSSATSTCPAQLTPSSSFQQATLRMCLTTRWFGSSLFRYCMIGWIAILDILSSGFF